MKSLLVLVIVLAFISLSTERNIRSVRLEEIRQQFVDNIQQAKWYQKGLVFISQFLKEFRMDTDDTDPLAEVEPVKPSFVPLLRHKIRF